MRSVFYVYGSADSKANATRVCRSGCALVRGKGISPEEQPCGRQTEEIAEVPYQELSKLARVERI